MKVNRAELLLNPSFNSSSNYHLSLYSESQIKKLCQKQDKMEVLSNLQNPIESSSNHVVSKEANLIKNFIPVSNILLNPQNNVMSEREKRLKLREAEKSKKRKGIKDSIYGIVQGSTFQLLPIEEKENVFRNPIENFIEGNMIKEQSNYEGNHIEIPLEFHSRESEIRKKIKENQNNQNEEIKIGLHFENSKNLKNVIELKGIKELVESENIGTESVFQKERNDTENIPILSKYESANIMDRAFEREAQNKLKQHETLRKEYLMILEKEKARPPRHTIVQDTEKVNTGLLIGNSNNEKEKFEKQIIYKNYLDTQIKEKISNPESKKPEKNNKKISFDIPSDKLNKPIFQQANSHDEFIPINNENEEDKMKKKFTNQIELDKQVIENNKEFLINKYPSSFPSKEDKNKIQNTNIKLNKDLLPVSDTNSNALIEGINTQNNQEMKFLIISKETEVNNIKENEQNIKKHTQKEEYKNDIDNKVGLKLEQRNEQTEKDKNFGYSIPFDGNIQTFIRYKKEINPEKDQKKQAQRQFIQNELKKQIQEKEMQKKSEKEKEKLEQIKDDERVKREIQKEKEHFAQTQKEKVKNNEIDNIKAIETIKIQSKKDDFLDENDSTHYSKGKKIDEHSEILPVITLNQSSNHNIEKASFSNQAYLLDQIPKSSNTGTINLNMNEIKQTSSDVYQNSTELYSNNFDNNIKSDYSNQKFNNKDSSNVNQTKNLINDEAYKKIIEIMKILMEKDKALSDREIIILNQLNSITGTGYVQTHLDKNRENTCKVHIDTKVQNEVQINQSLDIFEESLQSDTHFIKVNEFYNFNKNLETDRKNSNLSQKLDQINGFLTELKQENPQGIESIEVSKELLNIESQFVPCIETAKDKDDLFKILNKNKNQENSILTSSKVNKAVIESTCQVIGNYKQNKEEVESEKLNSKEFLETEVHKMLDFCIKDEDEVNLNSTKEDGNNTLENEEKGFCILRDPNSQENDKLSNIINNEKKNCSQIECKEEKNNLKENRSLQALNNEGKNNIHIDEVNIDKEFFKGIKLDENNQNVENTYENNNDNGNNNKNENNIDSENKIKNSNKNFRENLKENLKTNHHIIENFQNNNKEITIQAIADKEKNKNLFEKDKLEEANTIFQGLTEINSHTIYRQKPKIIKVFKNSPFKPSKKWNILEEKSNIDKILSKPRKNDHYNEFQILNDIDAIVSDIQNNLPSADEISAKLRATHAIQKENGKEKEFQINFDYNEKRKFNNFRHLENVYEMVVEENNTNLNLNYDDEIYKDDFEEFSENDVGKITEINNNCFMSEKQNLQQKQNVGLNILKELNNTGPSILPNNSTKLFHLENTDVT